MMSKLTLSLKKKKNTSYSLESLTTTAREAAAVRFLWRTAIGNFGQDQKKKKKRLAQSTLDSIKYSTFPTNYI